MLCFLLDLKKTEMSVKKKQICGGRKDVGKQAYQMFPADVQQLLVVKEEDPPEWSPTMDPQVLEPVHIKEEQEELLTGQQGERLDVLEGADINRFQFTAVTVKSENEEEDSRSSQSHQSQTEHKEAEPPASSSTTQIKTETDGEDYGESKPVMNLDMSSLLQPNFDEKASDSSETEDSYTDWQEPLSDSGPEAEDNDNWVETRATESCVNAVKYVETTVGDVVCNSGENSFVCFHCGQDFYQKGHYDKHMRIHTGEKPFACELCGKRFAVQGNLKRHMRVHTGEKPFACDVCGKVFTQQGHLKTHVRVHTGEKPFACELCGKEFTQQGHLKRHMRVHEGEKLFACEICGKGFTGQGQLKTHMRFHTEETRFANELSGKGFSVQGHLKTHMRVHT